jgi:glycosyltransferase involved in cell wall biosynthesis
MKTIIYTGAFRFPIGDAGAPRVLNNAKILREIGYNVIFVSYGGSFRESDKSEDGNYYYEGFRYLISNDIDIKENNILKRLYNFFYSGRKALEIIAEMKENIDVIIGYNPSMFFTNKILKLCDRSNIHFVSDISEWHDSNEFPGGRFAPPSWINSLNMNLTQKKVKNKILISSFLDKFYKSSNNIILPPLVDSNDLKWSNMKPVLPYFDGIRVIYAGTPAKKDLLEIMLSAFFSCLKRGLNLQFVVVGVTKEDISHYKNYQDVLAFPNNIIFCGRVMQTEVPSYYNVSDFSIIVRESTKKSMAGFPTKLAETMMAGRPVLLNYTSDIEQYVNDGNNGFVMPNWSSSELEKLLSHIVNLSREEINLLKGNALKCALKKFNYNVYIDEMNEFFEKIED